MSLMDIPVSTPVLHYFRSLAVSEMPSRPFGEITAEETHSLNSYYLTIVDDTDRPIEIMKIHRRQIASYSFQLPETRQPATTVFAIIGPDLTEESLRVVEYRDTLTQLQYLEGRVDETGRIAQFSLYRRDAMFVEKYAYSTEGEWTTRTLVSADGQRQLWSNPAEVEGHTHRTKAGQSIKLWTHGYELIPEGAEPVTVPTSVGAYSTGFLDVALRAVGNDKIAVVNLVMSRLGLSLKQAEELVESAPVTIARGIHPLVARFLQSELKDFGADVDLVLHLAQSPQSPMDQRNQGALIRSTATEIGLEAPSDW